ncbi:hypothetical protein EXIGLDRAFT_718445 [Exidia glandulosa HHB12029]|uniref:Uncharacterized protein n=1 Tax=Exidia glandulosa HHB12029 TaxID=1314781 RepID=A0A165HRE3_EXIGL|nr:hypothetical protein EXIGLDRAFT_718445 [Exidia glandulosa HHB12029]
MNFTTAQPAGPVCHHSDSLAHAAPPEHNSLRLFALFAVVLLATVIACTLYPDRCLRRLSHSHLDAVTGVDPRAPVPPRLGGVYWKDRFQDQRHTCQGRPFQQSWKKRASQELKKRSSFPRRWWTDGVSHCRWEGILPRMISLSVQDTC